jgi:hypothetical protein
MVNQEFPKSSIRVGLRPFQHLRSDAVEYARAKLALIAFPCLLAVCFIFVNVMTKSQREDLDSRVAAVNVVATNALALRNNLDDLQWLTRTAGMLFLAVHNRVPSSTDEHDVTDIRDRDLRPLLTGTDGTRDRDRQRLTDHARAAARNDLVLLRNALPIRTWFVFGSVYWFCVLLLYAFGLKPSKGEPAFNIFDVGLFGILIQYSGSFHSAFIIVFMFSLAFAAYDFAYQESLVTQSDAPIPVVKRFGSFLSRLALILGPYTLALLTSIFWAISDGVLLTSQPLQPYLVRWAQIAGAAIPVWIIFYFMFSYVITIQRTKLEAGS